MSPKRGGGSSRGYGEGAGSALYFLFVLGGIGIFCIKAVAQLNSGSKKPVFILWKIPKKYMIISNILPIAAKSEKNRSQLLALRECHTPDSVIAITKKFLIIV